jgi:hypothetical protein
MASWDNETPPADENPIHALRRIQGQLKPANLALPLDEQVEVTGEERYQGEIRRLFRECGVPITLAGNALEGEVCFLVPEPWNPGDPNAIAVLVRNYQVGYIPPVVARRYYPPLLAYGQQGQLVTGVARVWGCLESGATVRARATIAVPKAELLPRE